MADLQFAVRKLEKQFADEYYNELRDHLEAIADPLDRLQFLQRLIRTFSSSWSGGFSATNLEEQIKRETAIHLLDWVISQLKYEATKEAV
jgi:hypothetical protein